MIRTRYHYDRVAWCYEWIAELYSFGAIARAKAAQTKALRPGQRVLYVGVGAGEDAVLAAERGASLTCLDLSGAMLARLSARLDARSLQAELIEGDVFDYAPGVTYDVVVANFVLNVFSEATVAALLKHLATLLAPGGKILIADFAPPSESAGRRALYAAYYRPINWAAWSLRLCELHPIYNYPDYFEAAGLVLASRSPFALWRGGEMGGGPTFYENLVAVRPGALPNPEA